MASNFAASPQTTDSFLRPTAGQPDDSTGVSQSALVNAHSDAIEAIEGNLLGTSIYTPTANGNGLTVSSSTWAGAYKRTGDTGRLWLGGDITAPWSGSGYLSIPLPLHWQASGVESVGACWGNPVPVVGVHWRGTAVVHPAAQEVRFIANIVQLASAGYPGYCTATASTDLFACGTTHGLVAGDQVSMGAATSSGAAAGLTIGTSYYVIASGLTTTAFKVSATSGGSAVNITADGTAFVAKQVATKSTLELPVNGVSCPPSGLFTGGGSAGSYGKMYAEIEVSLGAPI